MPLNKQEAKLIGYEIKETLERSSEAQPIESVSPHNKSCRMHQKAIGC